MFTVDVEGSSQEESLLAGPGISHPQWSANGRRIAYLKDGNLYVLNPSNDQETQINIVDGSETRADYFSWSPSASELAFGNEGRLYVFNADERASVQVSGSYEGVQSIAWRPLPPALCKAQVNVNDVRIRAAPSTEAEVLGKSPVNLTAEVLDARVGAPDNHWWYRLKFPLEITAVVGWVAAAYTREITPCPPPPDWATPPVPVQRTLTTTPSITSTEPPPPTPTFAFPTLSN
jgi:hypothetical protein